MGKFVAMFFDDIILYNPSFESHLTQLESIFCTLLQGQFFSQFSKCLFAQQNLE